MVKKISIVVEDTHTNKICVIPISKKQAHNVYDFVWMTCEDQEKDIFLSNLKLNHCDDSFYKLHEQFEIVMDCLSDGVTYQIYTNKRGKISSTVNKNKYYHNGKRPRCRNK